MGLLMLGVLLFSCSKKDGGDIPDGLGGSPAYFIGSRVENPNGQSGAFYGQTVADLNALTAINVQQATEISPAGGGWFAQYGKMMYMGDFQANVLTKCEVGAEGKVAKGQQLSFNDFAYIGIPAFWKEDVAFVGDYFGFKISIFDPTAMHKTGEIDLTDYSRMGEVSNFPSTGTAIGLEGIAEMAISGQYLFVGLQYLQASMLPAANRVYVVVIDLDKLNPAATGNKDAVEKVIEDDRCNTPGSGGGGFGARYMVVDEQGDLYMLAHNYFGLGSDTGQPAAILRIKKGETTFDNGYFFNLEAAAGNTFVCGLEYGGAGKFITAVMDKKALDPSNPYASYLDPVYHFAVGDLKQQSVSLIEGIPLTKGSRVSKTYFEGNSAYIPFSTTDEQALYEVDIQSRKVIRKLPSVGDAVLYNINW